MLATTETAVSTGVSTETTAGSCGIGLAYRLGRVERGAKALGTQTLQGSGRQQPPSEGLVPGTGAGNDATVRAGARNM